MNKCLSCCVVIMFVLTGYQSLLAQNQKSEKNQQSSQNKVLNQTEAATDRSELRQRFLEWRFGLFICLNMTALITVESFSLFFGGSFS